MGSVLWQLYKPSLQYGRQPYSLQQGQFGTFPWLESMQPLCVIYTIQGSACQCLQCLGVDFPGRDVLRNEPHWSKFPINAHCVYQITVTDLNQATYFEIDFLWCLLKNLPIEYLFVLYCVVNCL